MGKCNESASNSCYEYMFSTCVEYQGELGANTKITKNCVNQNDVNEDLYSIVDEIIEESDLSELGQSCLSYPLVEGKLVLKSVSKVFEEEICSLKTRVNDLETLTNFNITGLNLDLKCLVDACGDPITTLGPLLQSIIDKVCENNIN